MIINIKDEKVNEYINKIHSKGGHCYIVGGYVRDKILGIESQDLDIEVYGMSFEELVKIFDDNVKVQGNFGVLILKDTNAEFSIPRLENKVGKKHQDFEINMNPNLSLKEAAYRRDFTVNSIMYDLVTNEIIDNYCGIVDLKNRVLRRVSEKFNEDPLRVLRAIRFANKYNLTIERETLDICLQLKDELSTLSNDRVSQEYIKTIMCEYSSVGMDYLNIILLPFLNINGLDKVEQSSIYHPEGDVWTHTKQSLYLLDKKRELFDQKQYRILYTTLLFHDIGKITKSIKNDDGKISAHGHEVESYKLLKSFIDKLITSKKERNLILNLVKDHMLPFVIHEMRTNTIIGLFNKYEEDIYLLSYVSMFDKSARSKNFEVEELFQRFDKIQSSVFAMIGDLYTYYKLLLKKYNGSYFIDRGYSGVKIKEKQREKIVKKISMYRKSKYE